MFPVLSETFIVNQIIALKHSGHTVHIFAAEKFIGDKIHNEVNENELLKDTFYLNEMPSSRLGKIRMLLRALIKNPSGKNLLTLYNTVFKNKGKLSVYELIHYLNKPEYDVLHAHFGINGNYVTELGKLGLFKQAKFITTFHGYDLVVEKNFYKQLFNTCDLFTANTLYTKQKLMDIGCPENKIHLLPVGLDTALFSRKNVGGKDHHPFNLLFAGRLIALKGPVLFVEICKKLKQNSSVAFKAVIAGDGELYNELNALIKNSGLSDEIEMVGEQTQDQIIELMNNADVFILPGIINGNRAEAQGLVIQEAQAMELPVIVSDAGGMKYGLIDGQTGYVVNENDIDGFVKKIELLAQDIDLRKRMGKKGRKYVEENYDSKILNKKLVSIYYGNEREMN